MKTQKIHTTKVTTTLAAFAVCATMMAPLYVYGQQSVKNSVVEAEEEQDERLSMDDYKQLLTELPAPIRKAESEITKADNYTASVGDKLEKNKKALDTLEASYQKDYDKAKNDTEKNKITSDFLRKRGDIIKSTMGDLEFAVTEFEKVANSVNQFLGDIDGNRKLADKASQENAKAEQFKETVREIERSFELLTLEKHDRGTPEYADWKARERKLRSDYELALVEFDTSVYLSEVFGYCAKQLSANGDHVEQWLDYISESLSGFSTEKVALKGAQDANDILLTMSDFPQRLETLAELGGVVSKAKDLRTNLQRVPPVKLGAMPPPPVNTTRSSLGKPIDFDQRKKDIESGLKLPKGK